jgi:hypothetical protein
MKDLKAIRFIEGTKISHDYEGKTVTTFSYRDLITKGVPCIGIPAKQNGLIIIDVDVEGAQHKKDGREYWINFCAEKNITPTYTVQTRSGGYHFYYRLPTHIDPDLFRPPSQLAPGVDIKYNGWVAAPPSPGYSIVHGNTNTIAEAPEALLEELFTRIKGEKGTETFDTATGENALTLELHRPFSETQLKDLKRRLEWFQVNGSVSYSEWRDGLFALKAGVDDPVLLSELVEMWTHNRSYSPGDEVQAEAIVANAAKHGPIGPGTIFGIIKECMLREGASSPKSPFSVQEVFDRSGVPLKVDSNGTVSIEANETNVASIIGSMIPPEELYHDVRLDLFMYQGRAYNEMDLVNIICPMIQSSNHGLGLQKIRRNTILGGLEVLMSVRRVDPHRQWMDTLVWDGVPRVDKFFHKYVGVLDCRFVTAVSKYFWLGLADRGLNPGCKLDSMIVLEGAEGIRKSSLIEAIAGEYIFCPTNDNTFTDLDDLRCMHQAVLVELPELIGLINQNANTIKGFLSKPFDVIRALFAKKGMKHLRSFVLIGTTNDSTYLQRSMGVRRFLPIEIPSHVKTIDTNAIKCDRAQLFAESIHRVKAGETYYNIPMEDLAARVASKAKHEPLTPMVNEYLSNMTAPSWTTEDVYRRLVASDMITKGYNEKAVERIDNALYACFCERFTCPSTGRSLWRRRQLSSAEISTFI